MNWAGICLIVLWTISITIALTKHGEERADPNYNFYMSALALAIEATLVYFAGGFG